MWSVSEAKTFRRCQRQWYFRYRFASPLAVKQPLKREAYLLQTLQSVSAWRGQVVDKVIETVIVPALMRHTPVSLEAALLAARRLFEAQQAFATQSRAREIGMTKEKGGDDFSSLLVVEETGAIPADDLALAWVEVERSLRNLYRMESLLAKLGEAKQLLAQRTFWFELCGYKIKAIPDLVAYFNSESPLVVDWKVHHSGVKDSEFQLKTYALAVARQGATWPIADIRLAEVQLLTGQHRHYRLKNEQIGALENEILGSISAIELATEGRARDDLNPLSFPAAHFAQTCAGCGFKKICWSTEHDDRN
jgi:hypothetical protein